MTSQTDYRGPLTLEAGRMLGRVESPQRFKEGDKVRDRANLRGTVLETWGNGVKVSWRNGTTGWIDERFLRRTESPSLK